MRVFNVIKISVGMFTNCDSIPSLFSLQIGILKNMLSSAHKVFNNYIQYSASEKKTSYLCLPQIKWYNIFGLESIRKCICHTRNISEDRLKYTHICEYTDTSQYGQDTFLQSRPQSEMLYNATAGLEYMIKDVHRGFPYFCRP